VGKTQAVIRHYSAARHISLRAIASPSGGEARRTFNVAGSSTPLSSAPWLMQGTTPGDGHSALRSAFTQSWWRDRDSAGLQEVVHNHNDRRATQECAEGRELLGGCSTVESPMKGASMSTGRTPHLGRNVYTVYLWPAPGD